jgi:crotonobetainyl-CoA hydratase
MTEVIQTRIDGGIFEVTLDRPKANAIDLATSRKMGDVFQSFRDDESLRVCILRTAGEKFFSAGWDLKAAAAGDSVTADYGVGGFGGLQELRDLNKPVIAAVEGMCVGGGFEIALSCDLILATAASSFALPEIPRRYIGRRCHNKTAKAHTVSCGNGFVIDRTLDGLRRSP